MSVYICGEILCFARKGACRVLQCAGNYQGIFVLLLFFLWFSFKACMFEKVMSHRDLWQKRKNMYIFLLITKGSVYKQMFLSKFMSLLSYIC